MDLVEIARLRSFHDRWGDVGLRRLFTPDEIGYCLAQTDPAPSLSARFAAKEAFFKAVGQGWGRGGDWGEVEVRRGPLGAPEMRWRGRAARAVDAVGGRRSHLTLSHSRSTAGAMLILEA